MATHSSILAWRIPMDRGAWQATVHGVEKSRTRLSARARVHTHTHTHTHGVEKRTRLSVTHTHTHTHNEKRWNIDFYFQDLKKQLHPAPPPCLQSQERPEQEAASE